jgi:putative hydrolase of the HAD superfamily
MFPGLFRQCLYTDRSDAFIDEAVAFMLSCAKYNSVTSEEAFQALLAQYPADKTYSRKVCMDYYYAHIRDYVRPFPETLQILQKLRDAGVKMAIVTNITPELLEHQKKKVQALQVAQYFDAVIYSAEFGIHKPDRRIFDHAATCVGVDNGQCLFVGDNWTTDVLGGLEAGMEVVWLNDNDENGCFDDESRVHRVSALSEYFAFDQ